MQKTLYSVKMRASRAGAHVSGAERIVEGEAVARTLGALARRAEGRFDFMNLKVEAVEGARRLPALRVVSHEVPTPRAGWELAGELLCEAGVSNAAAICEMFHETRGMRGAILLDADTLERLESDHERGVRATMMDGDPSSSAAVKNHFAEALVLATKVQAAPGVIAEICVSDDPGYVTGYVAVDGAYHRISRLKEPDSTAGGRIFLYRGERADVAKTVEFLERAPVVVDLHAPQALPRCIERRFDGIAEELEQIERAGLKREIRARESRSGALADFTTNDYFALARDARVANAAAAAAREYGGGAGASRLVSGTLAPHVRLEKHLAAFRGAEDAIAFSTGYMANTGAISALAGKGDVIFSDELNHASIIDGCRLSGAEVQIYRHLDMADLEARLARSLAFRRRLVVSDGVFSMDGDVLERERFIALCRRYDAFSMIDDAHTIELPRSPLPDIAMGTLSKSLGAMGGYVAGRRMLVEYLRQRARPFIFSTAPVPAAAAAADAALHILETESWRVGALQEKVALMRSALGICAPEGARASAIIPFIIGDERAALAAAAELEAGGYAIPAIRYPTVAKGAARLRIAVNAALTDSQLAGAAELLKKIARRNGAPCSASIAREQ